MLVNFDKNLIFLRPYFCGSTSTEFSLSLFCKNKRDIITPISFPEEIRRRELKIYPQNFGLKYFEKPPFVYWLETVPLNLGFSSEFGFFLYCSNRSSCW